MPNQILIDGTTVAFPMVCEKCQQKAAMPFMAGTTVEHYGIRVAVRCRECGHEWAFDMASKSPARRPHNT